ncbi:N-acetylglucosamine-1-phosphodiester alpha-N-acetylglucosaminidase-like [Diadema antillarum]|uniref:N-acetylglucosamine-1-phosphodiester alpha-N-acetylglucosaminidase-like n=1 Tax=Diadema antillarum TaxID=105358 RepID=UPI003A8B7CF3
MLGVRNVSKSQWTLESRLWRCAAWHATSGEMLGLGPLQTTLVEHTGTSPLSCWGPVVVILIGLICSTTCASSSMPFSDDDVLTPYPPGQHGSPRSHRQIRECQPIVYGNVTHHAQKSHGRNSTNVQYPITTLKHFYDDFPIGQRVPGRIAWVNSPMHTVSVLEPFESGGCTNKLRATVAMSAKQEDCLLAVNAGFFNTRQGDCYGNVVSQGRLVQTSGGLQNAHFGIRKDGTLVFGYLSEQDVLQEENPFIQLVGGVGWLIRDGEIYVEESRKAECDEVEESGTVSRFFDMLSARVAVGSDDEGRIVIAEIDGQSGVRGSSLSYFASWLLSHGVKNAINLDGGGSATFVVNGTLVNSPSDHCKDAAFRCPRQVSTIVCVHEPRCNPRDCSGHGDCIEGECRCHDNWHGPSCDQLQCGVQNCSMHGSCLGGGCHCDVGYLPPDCASTCPRGWYGQDCSHHCSCENGGSCDHFSGECSCLPGYEGQRCEKVCQLGYHGPGCKQRCRCGEGLCPCHHISGSCSLQLNDTYYGDMLKVGQCLASQFLEGQHLVHFQPLREDKLTVALLIATAVATASILCNLLCLCFRCTCRCSPSPCQCCRHFEKHSYHQLDSVDYTDEDDDDL